MDVVALVSGGKDSCYSILRARQHGHRVVALAHICPPAAVAEPDSMMYQSVASSAVRALADALALPLCVARTSAQALATDMAYTPTPGDEVEDLVRLLRDVKSEHLGVQAVCAGALWSDYQRLRVESAASRAGLLSIAYLWRREQTALLDEMIDVGVDAVLVKVAGIGLGEQHLGMTLAEMKPHLVKLHEKFGSHVCGEGGEFETFVRWMPGMTKRVVLEGVKVVHHSKDPVAPVSYLDIVKTRLEDPTKEQLSIAVPGPIERPPLFADQPSVGEREGTAKAAVSAASCHQECQSSSINAVEKTSVGISGDFLHFVVKNPLEGRQGVTECAKRLKALLKENDETLGSVVYVILHLRSVSGDKYKDANLGYTDVFGTPECVPPPSRACVGMFPSNHPTILEAFARRRRRLQGHDSLTLHVQSLSEWAPPCIGPYAQFVEEDGVIHVSGVLPLYAPFASIPDNMSVPNQVAACAHNLRRTLEASRVNVNHLGLFVAYVVSAQQVEEVRRKMKEVLVHDRAIDVVLPVSGLPKGGLVEIRAVGSMADGGLRKPQCCVDQASDSQQQNIQRKSVICERLGFVITTAMSHGDTPAGHLNSDGLVSCFTRESSFGGNPTPFSLQIYVSKAEEEEFEEALESELSSMYPTCAVCIMRSAWMPDDAKMISIAAFSRQAKANG
ncbi:unnamed protein product [Chondrus crispus]|uniref:Diphthine--ammonia ligase n=1 Tax=Chondrus crispus TaxID=2769 RepID=R7QHB6_CHOCR|nr:unnamed protein product [Chondrus crispus]CDF37454.1 unnamed protein product [Chondrus crispus]|eukprot:XP_005717273.1 unnamed protein product [Chondrus crispus]